MIRSFLTYAGSLATAILICLISGTAKSGPTDFLREKVHHLGVKALVRNPAGQVMVLKVNQQRFTGLKVRDYWDIPGGRVQEGQSVGQTLLREVREETGLKHIESFSHMSTVVSNIEIPLEDGARAGLVLSVYSCVAPNSVIRLSDEHTDWAWVSYKEAANRLAYKYPMAFTDLLRGME